MKQLNTREFLDFLHKVPVLDVRSPLEFNKGHVPGAISYPLFSDEERAEIGTIYKKEGRKPAVRRGLEIVGPKMVGFVDQAVSMGADTFALYCWRGGMRSSSMAWLLEQYGFHTHVLKGGYKAYRNSLHEYFQQDLPLKVLTGYTGSKKTVLLQLLAEMGEQTVDLEGLAQHQGSSFGNQKSVHQPTTEHFQNLIYESFRCLDLTRPIWIEDECRRIGQVTQVESLYYQIQRSPLIVIEVPKEERVQFLVEDYGHLPAGQLIDATYDIKKKLGFNNSSMAIDHIRKGEMKEAVEVILQYYDNRYAASLARKQQQIERICKVKMCELESLAIKLSHNQKQMHAI